ncbi:MAG: 50S ribosomal protein L13 [Chitinivibrionales bacterium]
MKTKVISQKDIKHEWYEVDASNRVLGRLATKIAERLRGKDKPAFSPNQDHGDYIIVTNSDKVRLTGNKENQKTYFSHSTYPGGSNFISFKELMEKDSTLVVYNAVKGMLPKNTLGRAMLKKLYVYKGKEHPHRAQKPEVLNIKD